MPAWFSRRKKLLRPASGCKAWALKCSLPSVSKQLRLEIRVPVAGINPTVPSVSSIYRNANWRERELWDMFGIKAQGHPDLRRILMPADWEGHPLRKDYPLGYEEPQFTFNYDEINLRKPYAKD
jgi:NADH-quinone oxidoreductase subunit C